METRCKASCCIPTATCNGTISKLRHGAPLLQLSSLTEIRGAIVAYCAMSNVRPAGLHLLLDENGKQNDNLAYKSVTMYTTTIWPTS